MLSAYHGFTIKAVYRQDRRNFIRLSILGFFLTLYLFLEFAWLTQLARPDFNLILSLARFHAFPGPLVSAAITTTVMAAYIVLHELLHHLVFRAYGVNTKVHLLTWKPRVTVPDGVVCPKYQALAALLAPLMVLGLPGVLFWFTAPMNYLYLAVFWLSIDIGASVADIAIAFWLLKYPGRYLFGSEKEGVVVWGPG